MNMNFNQLRVFHAVAQAGSLSKAALRLHISQPAVSKHLKDLEAALDTVLFDRLPRGVRLTESGALLARYTNRVFALADEAQTALDDLRGLRRGHLAIGASTTIGNYLLPSALATFRKRYPSIELSLRIENTETIQARLVDRQIDLGFVEGLGPSPDLLVEPFCCDELVVIAPPGHWSARANRVTPHDLAEEDWVMREPGSGTRAVVEEALQRADVQLPEGLWLGGTEAIKAAVARGAGLAIVSRLAVVGEVSAGMIALPEVAGFPVRRPLYRLGLKDRIPSAAAAAMLAVLKDSFEEGC